MSKCDEVVCPLQEVLPSKEISDWIHNMNDVKSRFDTMEETFKSRPKTTIGSWLSVILAFVIFLTGAIYTAGIQGSKITDNSENIVTMQATIIRNTEKSSEEVKSIAKEVQANREVLAELKTMAQDVKDIKSIIFAQLQERK